ncbi:MAG: hypothetical protein HOP11_11800 [Saprospiraceae bacterium]|nr:hypothetical protein [Saprospiraceae bacterium]
MSKNFTQSIKSIYLKSFGLESKELILLLKKQIPQAITKNLVIDLHDSLLFVQNHPKDINIKDWAAGELIRLTQWCKRNKSTLLEKHYNTGLPYTNVYSYFSWTMYEWLHQKGYKCKISDYNGTDNSFHEFLKLSLLPHQMEVLQLEYTNDELLDYFGVDEKNIDAFILYHFSKLSSNSLIANELFEKQNFTIELELQSDRESICWNRHVIDQEFYHSDWLKKLDVQSLLAKEVKMVTVDENQRKNLEAVIKMSLVVLQRETEPVTYMEPGSLRVINLERGIQIVLFTMKQDNQLPYESYVGYTLFKNGYPAAYGGAWVSGLHALIGLNIFEWCRGGESALFFVSLLRVYHQIFDIRSFEVEPYQYGKDNPEGIESGAFWFYYRLGFKPVSNFLAKIAKAEFDKMTKDKKYKTKLSTLKKFTESNIILQLDQTKVMRISQVTDKVLQYTRKVNCTKSSNYMLAEKFALQHILKHLNYIEPLTEQQIKLYTELGLLALAFNIDLKLHKELMTHLLESRLSDVYAYQQNWRKLFCN